MMIDIAGVRGAISDAVCVVTSHNNIYKKKSLQTSTQKNLEFSTRVGT